MNLLNRLPLMYNSGGHGCRSRHLALLFLAVSGLLFSIGNSSLSRAQTVAATLMLAGGNPSAVAVNPVTNKIYAVSFGDGTTADSVTVIDGATNALTTVVVGKSAFDLSINSVTNKVYVISKDSTMTVIDGATNTTIAVALGGEPRGIAVNPVTNKIYVGVPGSGLTASSVKVIDGATNALTSVAVGSGVSAIAVNSVTNKIFVANSAWIHEGNTSIVTVIDGTTNATTSITVGLVPLALAVNSVTNKVYVANSLGNTVTVIDGITNTTATVPVGNNPISVAVNSESNKVYIVNQHSDTVTVIDGVSNAATSIAISNLCSEPYSVVVNEVSNKVYVGSVFPIFVGQSMIANIAVIDGVSNVTVGVPVNNVCGSIAANPVTNKVYAASYFGTVTVINGATSRPPVIITQPINKTIALGTSVSFTAVASGAPAPTYQWQQKVINSGGVGYWANLFDGGGFSGSATASLTISATASDMNGDQFRCIATNIAGSAESNAVELSIIVPPAGAVITITVE